MSAHFVSSVRFLRGVRCDQQAANRPDAAGAIVLTCSLHSAVMGTYSANNYDKDVKSAWEKNQGSLPGTDGIPREVSMRGREDRARWRVARPRDSSRLCVPGQGEAQEGEGAKEAGGGRAQKEWGGQLIR